ncbi:MAG TPA: methyltransferase [Myxococcaceae bacterium]|nr:methyltransferase [Myxococcaceae bacterium]
MLPARPHESLLRLSAGEGETLDAICGGDVRLLQSATGYRFNLDPILLAHFAARAPGAARGPVIELGTGCGVIPLILARKFGRREVTALEVQPGLYALAQRNVHLNRCERWISLVQGDLRKVDRQFQPGAFAHVICNPPYRATDSGRISPEEEKACARHEVLCALDDVLSAAAHLLRERGVFSLIFPTARLVELMQGLREHRLEPKVLRMVHARPDRPAKLLLLQAVKGGGASLEVLPPLVVHEENRRFSPEVRSMLEDGGEESPGPDEHEAGGGTDSSPMEMETSV